MSITADPRGQVRSRAAAHARLTPLRISRMAVRAGVPPAWTGYRWLEPRSLREQVEQEGGSLELIHPPGRIGNSLPLNATLEDLPADRGWWGYSFRDVPSRWTGHTVRATVYDCTIVPYLDPSTGEFHVCILTPDDAVLNLHEMAFRAERHPGVIRGMRPRRVRRATWILERVYHNHSHWLTSHLPKILLARERGLVPSLFLPAAKSTETIRSSLRMLGIGPNEGRRLDPIEPLRVEELTVIDTDRFRPELLRSVRRAFADRTSQSRSRRVYISRARAGRRRLVNEADILPLLKRAGFERVFMEDLSFGEQVRLMGEAEAVMAPHGAGLTNIMFSQPGTAVVEIADLGFPNPNFYAVAAAMQHRYWILGAETRGEGHALVRDMWIEPSRVEEALSAL